MSKGWIGVDLDSTLATYTTWKGIDDIGAPIPKMLRRVKIWLKEGIDVRIFTARVWSDGSSESNRNALAAAFAIEKWCVEHIGQRLPITNSKDYDMLELWDDRAVQIIPNTGERADEADC